MGQYIWIAVHTDYADGAKNIRMKYVIKRPKSIKQNLSIISIDTSVFTKQV